MESQSPLNSKGHDIERLQFPTDNDRELNRVREILRSRDVEVIPVGELGYVIHDKKVPYVAEAPVMCLDFDDTAATTTADKKNCKDRLLDLGIPDDLVAYCDQISRVDFGDRGKIYEPELDQRLLSMVLAEGSTSLSPELKIKLDVARDRMLETRDLEQYPINETVKQIYQETRYHSTLYPDTTETILRLKAGEVRPSNMVIFTYGDPEFQLTKVLPLIDAKVGLNQVWLTKGRKGDFFKKMIEGNTLQGVPLKYTYDETERGMGVKFADWRVLVILFDDDPSQVANFNKIANEEGILGLATVRVRREGVKRSDKDTELGRRAAELKMSDTYLDSALYEKAVELLMAVQVEDFLVEQVMKIGQDALSDVRYPDLLAEIAHIRDQSPEEAQMALLNRAGYKYTFVASDDDSETKVEIWSKA
ncbi:MAG TPA: hypothetical protein VI819_00620 [Patescibacteria group bacterium]|nr:hypothetical protein [Patescibacteria group bacterium]